MIILDRWEKILIFLIVKKYLLMVTDGIKIYIGDFDEIFMW